MPAFLLPCALPFWLPHYAYSLVHCLPAFAGYYYTRLRYVLVTARSSLPPPRSLFLPYHVCCGSFFVRSLPAVTFTAIPHCFVTLHVHRLPRRPAACWTLFFVIRPTIDSFVPRCGLPFFVPLPPPPPPTYWLNFTWLFLYHLPAVG